MGWIPAGDFAFPVDGDAVDFDSVLNASADGHGDWFGSEDLEFEESRGKHFEVFSSGEEGENFGEWARKPEFGLEGEDLHRESRLIADRGEESARRDYHAKWKRFVGASFRRDTQSSRNRPKRIAHSFR